MLSMLMRDRHPPDWKAGFRNAMLLGAVIAQGCYPWVNDPGSPLLAQRRPHSMFPGYESNVGFLTVRAGVLPLDEPGSGRLRAASSTFAGLGSGPSY